MPIYTCERCLKEFKQKGHLANHMKRKNPCQEVKSKLESMVESAVESKMENIIIEKKLKSKDTGNEAATNMAAQSKHEIRYENMNVKQLKDICRKNGIKGISDKRKNELIEIIKNALCILDNTNKIISDTIITKSTNNEVQKSKQSLKFIDLFCGIGGFHQVLKMLGCECVLACDIDKYCREVYKMNYGIDVEPDVRKLVPEHMPDFDILCGGFPCQTFSNAGKKKTFDDDRGLLFDEIIRIVRVKKPRFLFLENVKHILKVGDGKVLKYILEKLDKTGYNVQYFKMSPHEYGIPQQRERIYFVCVRKDIYSGDNVVLKYEKTKKICFNDYLDKVTDVPDKYFIKGDILKCLEAWDEMIKIFDIGEKISPTIMVNEFYNTYTKEEFSGLAKWRQEYITKNRPLYEKYKNKWDAWYTKHKDILSRREIYAKLEWQVGVIKENDSIFNYFIQMRQSGIRVKRARYFPTLVAISQIPIYGKEKRYLTPKEGLRLQSFPDDFKVLDNDKHIYKQLGNSVNVENVRNVLESTLKKYEVL